MKLFPTAVFLAVLAGCPTQSPETETDSASLTTEHNTSSSGSVVVMTTTGSIDSSSGSTAEPLESTGGGSTSGDDISPDNACKPTHLFCQQFESWCPFALDQASCDSVGPCEEQTSLCAMCKQIQDACFVNWGAGSPLCDLGYTKCLAAAPVEGCACQPAVFPCAPDAAACADGWKFQPNGNYCLPPCAEPTPFMEASTSGVTTGGDLPDGTTGTTDVMVTGGIVSSSDTGEASSGTSGGETGGDPPPSPDGPCGPAEYATCEEGYCVPHILVLCL